MNDTYKIFSFTYMSFCRDYVDSHEIIATSLFYINFLKSEYTQINMYMFV